VKAGAAVSNHEASLKRDRAELASLVKQHKGIGAARVTKQAELEGYEASLSAAEAGAADAEAASAAAMVTYQNAMAGKVDDEGSADTLSLPEQVRCACAFTVRYFASPLYLYVWH